MSSKWISLSGEIGDLDEVIYNCNGINDNEILSALATNFINNPSSENNTLYIKGMGVFGADSPVAGDGSNDTPYVFLQALNPNGSGKRIIFDMKAVDFTQATYTVLDGKTSVFAMLTNCEFYGDVTFVIDNGHAYGIGNSDGNKISGNWTVTAGSENATACGIALSSNNDVSGNWKIVSENGVVFGVSPYSSDNTIHDGRWLLQASDSPVFIRLTVSGRTKLYNLDFIILTKDSAIIIESIDSVITSIRDCRFILGIKDGYNPVASSIASVYYPHEKGLIFTGCAIHSAFTGTIPYQGGGTISTSGNVTINNMAINLTEVID